MAALADMDADKKIAVLKKAILALTKQKQEVEAARASLEAKVTSLMEELGRAEERNNGLIARNRELTAEVDRLNSSNAKSLAAVPGAAAKSLLSTLGTLGTTINNATGASHKDSNDVDHQRLFEENEALHIQLFEQRSEYERRIKQLEAERAQQAMRVHSLEGLVASVQASDVATSQQVTEARRALAIEKGYTNLCQYMLLRGLAGTSAGPTTSSSHGGPSSASLQLLPLAGADGGDALSAGDPSAVLGLVAKRCCEVIQHCMSGVSAVLPHTLVVPSPTAKGGSALAIPTPSPQQAGQDAQRLRLLIAAHRESRHAINALCAGLLADLGGDESGGGGGGGGDVDGFVVGDSSAASLEDKELLVADRLVALIGSVSAWLNVLHNNAAILLGPLESLHAARCRQLLGGGGGAGGGDGGGGMVGGLQTLEQQFQSVAASIIGELRVVRDCLRGAAIGAPLPDATSTDEGGSSSPSVFPFALRMLGAMLSYRNECAYAASSSHGGKLSLERLLYSIEAAANYQPDGEGGAGSPSSSLLPTHYHVPLTHLVSAVKEASRQWGSAFGALATFDGGVGPSSSPNGNAGDGNSGSGVAALATRGGQAYGVGVGIGPTHRPKGALSRAMASYFAACPGKKRKAACDGNTNACATPNSPNAPSVALLVTPPKPSSASPAAINTVAPSHLMAMEEEVIAQLRAADANASHCFTISQRAMLELAHCHDRIEQLTSRNTVVESDNDRMRKEYVSVVEVYESQIRLLSDHLAELAQEGSVAANGKKR